MHKDHERYCAACDFPATLDEAAVETGPKPYLKALGVERKVQRLHPGWQLVDYPSLDRYVDAVLDEFEKRVDARDAQAAVAARNARDAQAAVAARDAQPARDARDAQVALDARDAQAALDAQAAVAARNALNARNALDARDARGIGARTRLVQWCILSNWSWWRVELSWIVTTHFGAKTERVRAWSGPLFESYIAGAWILHWTDDTLF